MLAACAVHRAEPVRHLRSLLPCSLSILRLVTCLGAALVACSAPQKKQAAETALDAMREHEQLEAFEATARVLDPDMAWRTAR